MAILTAVFASALLTALGVSLALLGTGETTLAGRGCDTASAAYAARAALTLGVAELRLQPSWVGVLKPGSYPELSASPSQIVDTSLRPTAPWGAVLDVRVLTSQLQAETDAAGGVGDPMVWRLFAYGPIGRLVPAGPWTLHYLLVWVSDDGADGDANPSADTNGSILLHAEALGPAGLRGAVEATVWRRPPGGTGPDGVRVLTIRPQP